MSATPQEPETAAPIAPSAPPSNPAARALEIIGVGHRVLRVVVLRLLRPTMSAERKGSASTMHRTVWRAATLRIPVGDLVRATSLAELQGVRPVGRKETSLPIRKRWEEIAFPVGVGLAAKLLVAVVAAVAWWLVGPPLAWLDIVSALYNFVPWVLPPLWVVLLLVLANWKHSTEADHCEGGCK